VIVNDQPRETQSASPSVDAAEPTPADLEPTPTKRALVIGGGIAGIQAALDLANARIRVTLVEKSPSLGGRMSQLDKTFPTMDCSI
jgi:heterodisulfide reductase subunit A-like polyferredoxin